MSHYHLLLAWKLFGFPSCLQQLNLKFEIEVLCKNLSLDINDLKPGNLLKDKEKLKSLEEQLSAPKKEAKPPEELLPVSTTGGSTTLKYLQLFLFGFVLGWVSFKKNYLTLISISILLLATGSRMIAKTALNKCIAITVSNVWFFF